MARKRLGTPNPVFLDQNAAPPPQKNAPIAGIAGQASEAAALRDLADEMARARDEGRFLEALPLAAIDTGWLVRDRIDIDPEGFDALKNSIRAHGQRTPIEVVRQKGDASTTPLYGLVSGLRRFMALRDLYKETDDARFGSVRAIISRPEDEVAAYLAMVEENEIREGISYYERARLVVDATEKGVFADEATALSALFANVSRAKRSKIKSFVELHHALGSVLVYPTHIAERLGLALVAAARDDAGFAERVADRLANIPETIIAHTEALKELAGDSAPTTDTPPTPDVSHAKHSTSDMHTTRPNAQDTSSSALQEPFEKLPNGIKWREVRGGVDIRGYLTHAQLVALRNALKSL